MWKCNFAEEPVDLKLLCLRMMRKAGIILAATIAGALVLGGIFFLKETVFSPNMTYQVVGETFIDYIPEEAYGISRVYITDEAWDSLAKSDAFVESIISEVSGQGYAVSEEQVRESIDASVVSDSFVVTTTVYAKEEGLAVAMNAALQNAIVDFCLPRQEVAESFIMTCPTSAEKREVTKEVLVAALIGAVLGLCGALVVCMVSFLMDDSVYLPVSFEKRYGIPMFGTKESEELSVNAEKLCEEFEKLAVVGICEAVSTEEVTRILQDKVSGIFSAGTVLMTKEWLAGLAGADGIVLAVAAGRRDGKQIERTIDFLKKQNVTIVAAVLCNADETLLARYYRPGILGKYKKISAKRQTGDEA
ncbi:MAG: hypothetical protein IJX66_08040 [Lachnospiraceae bacterium]|nr:hypothetical protein [Lachnospiraceae bacterium]